MKNKYILRFAFLASLFCGATGVFAQDANTNAPVPSVRDIDLCKDGTYDAMDGVVRVEDGYDLIWFVDPTDTIGRALSTPPATTVDVATPGKYTYYVAQRMNTAPYAQSNVVSFDVTVYGVDLPLDKSTHEYCANDEAEPLKAIKQENLLNYYGADDVWFKFGATEYEEVLPDTRVNSTMTYDYEAYQKFRIPLTGEVCIGPSIDIEVKVVAVGRPFFNGGVTYNKYEAEDTKKFEDILVKYPDAIESIPGQTLLWSKNETGPFVSGSTSSSKPTYDEFTPAGMTEIQNRWAIWKATTENGLVCTSEPSVIDIIIKSATAPLVKNVEICKDDYVAGAIDLKDFAIINDNNGMMSATDYQLYWYTDKAKAEAAIKNGPSEGSATAPALNTIIDITTDPMFPEWEGEVYVIQSDGFTTSPASTIRITVNASPRLLAMPHGPECMEPVDLTNSEYWVIDNVIAATVQYTFNGSVVENPKAITQSGEYEITATSQHGCVSDPLKLQIDIITISTDIEFESMSVCAGDAIVLDAAVVSAGAKVTWYDEEGNPLGVNPGPVVPEFKGSADMPTYKYTYYAEPFSDIITCPSKRFPLSVEVYRPLEGALEDQTICDGQTVRINAGSYGATTYTWTVNGETIKDGPVYKDKPKETTLYQVNMTRGACEAKGYAEVIVYPNPVIEFIDSMDFRDIMIKIDNISNSNYPYTFIIDDTIRTEDSYIKGLSFSKHTFKVEDAKGCVSKTYEYRVLNPNLPPEMSWMVPPIEGDEDSVELILANDPDEIINVYTISGALIKSNVKRSEALNGLANGAYLVGGQKTIVNK